jgi:hypothetical protein
MLDDERRLLAGWKDRYCTWIRRKRNISFSGKRLSFDATTGPINIESASL